MTKRKQQVYKLTKKNTAVYYIGRKRYNLDKATIIAEHWGGGYVNTGLWWKEVLSVTDQGSWVLHGMGERETKYGQKLPNGNYIEGTKVQVLSRIEAYDWLEKNQKIDCVLVDRYFIDIVKEG